MRPGLLLLGGAADGGCWGGASAGAATREDDDSPHVAAVDRGRRIALGSAVGAVAPSSELRAPWMKDLYVAGEENNDSMSSRFGGAEVERVGASIACSKCGENIGWRIVR